jgi:Putative Flp pilus-assembly TadE/G-like
VRRLLGCLRGRLREERGSVLVITAISMVAMLGMTALVVDVGSWYQVRRQAQDAADAAALAGAADLPSSASTATTDAQTYGNKNMNCTSCTTVTTPYGGNSSEIQATVTTTAPSFFGHLFGITSAAVKETAIAEAPAPSVSGPLFASSTSCSAITGNVNSSTIQGIVTNGGMSATTGWNNATVSSVETNTGACGAPNDNNGSDTFSTTTSDSGTLPYPVDYRAASQTITCNGNDATVTESGQTNTANDTTSNDTYTYSQSSLTFSANQMNTLSGVYCASSITLDNSAPISGNATFIANSFSGGQSDTGTVTPADGSLLMWQTGSSELQINSPCFINGTVIFAPYAEIFLNSNALTGGTQTTLLEGSQVGLNMNSGTLNAPSTLTGGGVPELIG